MRFGQIVLWLANLAQNKLCHDGLHDSQVVKQLQIEAQLANLWAIMGSKMQRW